MRRIISTHGYYRIAINAVNDGQLLMRSNDERAFIVSQLQELLSPRSFVRAIPAHMQLASCVDLLAFSVRRQAVELLIFSIDAELARSFAQHLSQRLVQYQDTQNPWHHPTHAPLPFATVSKLKGPHQALAYSVAMHLLHEDWEYDRYSSIGFYLHDRRGDWMRTWRLAELYGNSTENYRLLAHAQLQRSATLQLSAA